MKCVITILQNKRVSMPYLFGKYVFPMMQRTFRGEVKIFHIWHAANGAKHSMTSNRVLGKDRLRLVKKFIDKGRYPHATIVRHERICNFHPSLPSVKLALDVARKEKADFHLWLEDDAIIYDQGCGSWAITLGSADVGLYTNTAAKEMINTAYFLSTREFDERFRLLLNEYREGIEITANKGRWDEFAGRGSLIEHLAWRASRKSVFFGSSLAFRHHPYKRFRKTAAMLREWLRNTLPGITRADLDLLALDFDDA